MGSTAATTATTATASGTSGGSNFFADTGNLFSALTGHLQLVAIGIVVFGSIAVLIQIGWASFHGNAQKREAHISHLEWIFGVAILVYAIPSIVPWVTSFFGG